MNHELPPSSETERRFVVLQHRVPDDLDGDRGDHFDLMLEQESDLATWAIDQFPNAGETVAATRLPNHRKLYLDYDGPISDGRGTVEQVMAGTYRNNDTNSSCLSVLLFLPDNSICLQILTDPDSNENARISRLEPQN